ncbi:uncharacterized protein FOMMEDRAFT_156255 [Fomitiporia mediterranea MF3/22]|uniref:uncharacterized protein n=1 Tax=Fomitiporia mediterranea (strain MF3/22) TaxID=694068 RepID=UPI00044079CA|nr:uncharacterized protein FOMMEDRAFT_156255 [Fomitiporia mediterranea MF3/22]EJD02892.1 hypothetical protein FOMMEDRAFT_156255 [Fomitiporia mediterranea MF3/22]
MSSELLARRECKWLKSIGADDAVNYKSLTFVEDLKKATPDKVDLFFDNVGGSILDEVMMRMNPHGAISIVEEWLTYRDQSSCIITGKYSSTGCYWRASRSLTSSITLTRPKRRLVSLSTSAAAANKLVVNSAETVVDVHGKVEEIPSIWNGLFTGMNTGKLVTKLAD